MPGGVVVLSVVWEPAPTITYIPHAAGLVGAVEDRLNTRRTRGASTIVPVPDVPSAQLSLVRDFCRGHLSEVGGQTQLLSASWTEPFRAMKVGVGSGLHAPSLTVAR